MLQHLNELAAFDQADRSAQKSWAKNPKFLSFRNAGCARESGIHEHRPTSILQMLVFIVSGPAQEGQVGPAIVARDEHRDEEGPDTGDRTGLDRGEYPAQYAAQDDR